MTFDDWDAVLRPKIQGSRNLIDTFQCPGPDSPWFLLLSSASGIIGNRGQANYAAANTYQDALAQYYTARKQRVVSIDLGPILGAGMLTRGEGAIDSLRASGFFGIRHEDFLTVIEYAIGSMSQPGHAIPPQIIVGVGTGGLLLQNKPADPYFSKRAIYSYLNIVDIPARHLRETLSTQTPAGSQDVAAQRQTCSSPEKAIEIISAGLVEYLSRTLNVACDFIDMSRPMSSWGVDSLVAVGVRNWVKTQCGIEVSVFEVLSETAFCDFVSSIAEKWFEDTTMTGT